MAPQPSDQTRHLLELAQLEAVAFGHDYVGTEHLLLALLAQRGKVPQRALGSLGVTSGHVKGEIERVLGRGQSQPVPPIPLTPAAEGALQRSRGEAAEADAQEVHPVHVLLGVSSHNEGMAARILRGLDLSVDQVRSAVAQQG